MLLILALAFLGSFPHCRKWALRRALSNFEFPGIIDHGFNPKNETGLVVHLEPVRFCVMARGSASELEYQLLLSRDLKLIQSQEYEQLTQQTVEIKRMLTVLVQKLNAEC